MADTVITPQGGQGKHAPVAAEDQARVIVAILENPEEHRGKIYPLAGPENLTQDEIVAEMSAVLGRTIKHEQVDAGDWVETLRGGGAPSRQGSSSRTLYGDMHEAPGYSGVAFSFSTCGRFRSITATAFSRTPTMS